MTNLSIGELAERTGVSTETIRYYERAGLLTPPPRTPAGHRRYGQLAIWELSAVRSARGLGFSVSEIRDMLDTARAAPAPYAAIRPIIAQRRVLLGEAIRRLQSQHRQLQQAVERYSGDSCTIIVPGSTPGYRDFGARGRPGSDAAVAYPSVVDRAGPAGSCACILPEAESALDEEPNDSFSSSR